MLAVAADLVAAVGAVFVLYALAIVAMYVLAVATRLRDRHRRRAIHR